MQRQETQTAVLFLLPGVVALALFLYFPIGQTFVYSLYDLQFSTDLMPEAFAGFSNYRKVFANRDFWRSIQFTAYFTFFSVSLEFIIGLAFALASFYVVRPLRALLRVIIILPWAVPPIIHAALFRWLYNADVGLFGQVLLDLGIVQEVPLFLYDPALAANSVIFAYVWKSAAITSIFLMSGLAVIPQTLHDAAQVDGAGAWTRFWKITLPLLSPTIVVTLLFRTIDALRVFDIIYGLTQGTGGTEVLSYFTYQFYFRFNQYGVGSAYAVVTFLLVMALSIFYIRRVLPQLRLREH